MNSGDPVALGNFDVADGFVRLLLTRSGSCLQVEVLDAATRQYPLWRYETTLRPLRDGARAAAVTWRAHRIFVRIARDARRVTVWTRTQLPLGSPAPPAETAPQLRPPDVRPAMLERLPRNPVLSARRDLHWETQAVFNAGALHLGGRVHLLYRAVGADGRSVLGHASSSDGVDFDERCREPVFQLSSRPASRGAARYAYSSGAAGPGAEDPRLVVLDDRVYLTYTAFDGRHPPRMAIASIACADFLARHWKWSTSTPLSVAAQAHKNWVLFPRRIAGRFAILHAMAPAPRIAYIDDIDAPSGPCTVSGYSNAGDPAAWDNIVRGAGPPPIETAEGWLVLYHAMDRRDPDRYKLGALLLDRDAPCRVRARLPYPLLEPDARYENNGHKRGVIYCCGAVKVDGALITYYGGADTVVCAARVPLDALLGELRRCAAATGHP